MKKIILLLIVCLSFSWEIEAKVKLPKLVSDNMVLQRDQPLRIWGTADPNESVTVTFLKKKYKTTASESGQWIIKLPSLRAGGPYIMTINDITIQNILVGDVWLCSGQSNMELQISRVIDMFANEVNNYENDRIRYYKVPLTYNFKEPQSDLTGGAWKALNPQEVMQYSAFAYFFAKDLYETTKIPQGIINSSVGGSPIEAWISEKGLKDFPSYIREKNIYANDEYIDVIRKREGMGQKLWQEQLKKSDEGLSAQWNNPNFDDSAWTKLDLFSYQWTCNGRTNAEDRLEYQPTSSDGVATRVGSHWFRRTFMVPDSLAGKPATLRLGCVVDADEAFVNGEFVGSISYQYPPRIYKLPAGLLKAGKNQITVRVISYGEYPHFVSDKPYKVIVGSQEIDLRGEWSYQPGAQMPASPGTTFFQYKPIGLYNGMIAPLLNYSVRGAVWYQGESNVGDKKYASLLTTMISDWRLHFRTPKLPVVIIQLPNFLRPEGGVRESAWANLREQQMKVTQSVANTALAVTIDVGEWNDIHPLNKKAVGHRAALQMRRLALNETKEQCQSPEYLSKQIKDNKIIISFKAGTDDLLPNENVCGFAIAGIDGRFVNANAKVQGKQVIVWSDEIADPVMVRYAWDNNPEGANLYNKAQLPASPFRTDK